MADHGVLYRGFDSAFVAAMAQFCHTADLMLPNVTEARLLAGLPQTAPAEEIPSALTDLGFPPTVITGVETGSPGTVGVLISDGHGSDIYVHPRVPGSCHGTGDLFAAALVGSWTRGCSLPDAARLAADFTAACLRQTGDDRPVGSGVAFEPLLPQLAAAVNPPSPSQKNPGSA